MTEEHLQRMMRGEADRLAAQAPPANMAATWHLARQARAMRLHSFLNLTAWAIRGGVGTLLVATIWLAPNALPAAVLPSLLLLWLSGGTVRRSPAPALAARLTGG